MSEFEKQNAEVFAMVHDNPRRSGVLTEIGYIVPGLGDAGDRIFGTK